MKNNIPTLCWLLTTPRNDSGDLIGSSGWKIVAAAVTGVIKTQSDLALVLGWHVPGQLMSRLVQLDSWMMAVEHVLQNLHGVTTKIPVVLIGHAIVESIDWIINIKLTVDRVLARMGKERASAMGESAMNLEEIWSSTIKHG